MVAAADVALDAAASADAASAAAAADDDDDEDDDDDSATEECNVTTSSLADASLAALSLRTGSAPSCDE